MENKKTRLAKVRENPYILSTIVLGLIILGLVFNFFVLEKSETNETNLCSIISGTPAWIVEGKIYSYGYIGNQSVDDLIENKVSFYYRNGCGYCELQIKAFDNWTKYKESGLTQEC